MMLSRFFIAKGDRGDRLRDAKLRGRPIKRSFAVGSVPFSGRSLRFSRKCGKESVKNGIRATRGERGNETDKTTLLRSSVTYLRYWRNMAQKAISSDIEG